MQIQLQENGDNEKDHISWELTILLNDKVHFLPSDT